MLCLMVQMSEHMYIQSNPVRAVDAERGLVGDPASDLISKAKKKKMTISFIILLHINLMLSHVPYVIYCIFIFDTVPFFILFFPPSGVFI